MRRQQTIELGERFGRLTFMRRKLVGRATRWVMRCDCGAEKVMQPSNVFAGLGLGCAKRGTNHAHGRGTCEVLDGERYTFRPMPAATVSLRDIPSLTKRVPASVWALGGMV